MALLEIRDLCVEFDLGSRSDRILDGISLSLDRGEALCLVGESGSGKSVLAQSVAKLLPAATARYARGSIRLGDIEVLQAGNKVLRSLRGGVVSYVFQEPGVSLHPTRTIEAQIIESLRIHQPGRATPAEVVRLLESVGIAAPALRARSYPHQLSGGMQQRVMIAMALASQPQVLIADEPTTALDVTVQAEILELLSALRRSSNLAVLLITHNLGIVAGFADRVAVMYAGQIVEALPASQLSSPRHPYTRALLASLPRLGAHERLRGIPGAAADPADPPGGCRFHPRCPLMRRSCVEAVPELAPVDERAAVRCPWWREPLPPTVSPDDRA
jgi:peptide/nickel transport system ATP-binding protein/oligopeptide transport system ATP-binding protein